MTDLAFLIVNIRHGLTGDAAGTRLPPAIRVRDGQIAEMGTLDPEPDERVIDATGCAVTPGLVNTHHHLFQSILKGLALNDGLDDWLREVPYTWWPLLDETALRISATVGLAELALTGTTTVADHHYVFSDRYDYDPAEVLFDAARCFGLRFMLARGGGTRGRAFDDPSIPPSPVEPLDRFLQGVEAAADRWHDPQPFAMTRVAVAPTTPTFNLAPVELAEVAQTARAKGLRLHSHLSENRAYARFTMEKYSKRPVEWLAEHGWLGRDVWFAHLVDCDPTEVSLLAETGTGMAHCPQANARLGSGIAPADELHAEGGAVSLAVDGAGANEAADMGAAMYSAFALHRASKGVASLRPETVLHWATEGGAKVLGWNGIGRLAPGMAADIAMFDITTPRALGLHDPALAPVLTGGAPVRHSFVGGRPLVVDGCIPGLELEDLAENALRTTERISRRKQEAAAARPGRA
ncbi:amidohydrolase family protein [Psychromarinibacter halotolerans]|uniref:Amidohydrolase family protein n=1 Tax=Psychromarinibacter halotolerans TaxID=1775175 RepID=A0ABV7GW37_9RHOB|nr:amidohydrolase family protein [Psychromarinibacter halotolerans]MDF0596195.1 amidohydrolase family protein [Psychromarinibacter halotolerans]